jgi:hypothetical protein
MNVVSYGYCDESNHMYNLGKAPSTLALNRFTAMVVNVVDTSMISHQHLGHTNFGSLGHMSRLHIIDDLP